MPSNDHELGLAATVAVASSVHGRVQRRQQQRWGTATALIVTEAEFQQQKVRILNG